MAFSATLSATGRAATPRSCAATSTQPNATTPRN